jgi:hypothetical protein
MIPFDNSPANTPFLVCRGVVDVRGPEALVRTAWKEKALVYSETYSYIMSSVLLILEETAKADHVECQVVAALRKSSRYRA